MADTKAQVVRAHRLTRVVWALLGMCAFSSANAASFDCAKAVSRIDNAICASPRVSKLDDDLEPVYLAVLANSADPDAIRTAQRAWLKTTRNQCQNEACLISVYEQRIAALTAVAPESFLEAKANVEAEDAADKNLAADEARSAASHAAREEEQKVAEQAIAAASAAHAQKVAEQVAAAASAAKARELEDKTAADARHSAEQGRLFVTVAGVAAAFVALAFGGWLWLRRREVVKAERAQASDTLDRPKTNPGPTVDQTSLSAPRTMAAAEAIEHGIDIPPCNSHHGSFLKGVNALWKIVRFNPIKSSIAALIMIGMIIGEKTPREGDSARGGKSIMQSFENLPTQDKQAACLLLGDGAAELVSAHADGGSPSGILVKYDQYMSPLPLAAKAYVIFMLRGIDKNPNVLVKVYRGAGGAELIRSTMIKACANSTNM